ncbi:hypothetical protein RK21_00243 [Pseudomonas plecoglossicida]|jgi:hypothetical protein|nr:hypothetical protein RK21_00243 [Pseudomonas plecoglossicida]
MHLRQTDGNLPYASVMCTVQRAGREISAKARKSWRKPAKSWIKSRFASFQTGV